MNTHWLVSSHTHVTERPLPHRTRQWLQINRGHLPSIGSIREAHKIEYLQMAYATSEGMAHALFNAGDYVWNLESPIMDFRASPRAAHASHARTKAELTSRQGVGQHVNDRFANPYHTGCVNLIWANLDLFCDTFFPADRTAPEQYPNNRGYVEVTVRCGPRHRKKPRAMDIVVERTDGALVVVEVGRRAPDRKDAHPKESKVRWYKRGIEELGLGVPVYGVGAYYFEEPEKGLINLSLLPV